MTWEEDMTVGRLQALAGPHPFTAEEERRKRGKRIRYFLTVWGAMHWPDRVERRPRRVARRGHISL